MTDLKNGIIEIDGFVITPKTTKDNFEKLPKEKVKIVVSKRGNKYFTLLTPIIANGIPMYIEPDFAANGTLTGLTLKPTIPASMPYTDYHDSARNALECCKIWLKSFIDIPPTADNKHCIYYKFGIVDYYASILEDRDYGVRFSDLKATFKIGEADA